MSIRGKTRSHSRPTEGWPPLPGRLRAASSFPASRALPAARAFPAARTLLAACILLAAWVSLAGLASAAGACLDYESRPHWRGRIDQEANRLVTQGPYAYASGGFAILNLSDPANPVTVFSQAGLHCTALDVDGPLACLADGNGGMFYLYDVRFPFQPTEIASVPIAASVRSVSLRDSLLCFACGVDGLWIYSLRSPVAPVRLAVLGGPGSVVDCRLAGARALVLREGTGLEVIDLSSPDAPRKLGSLPTPSAPLHLALKGDRGYLSCGSGGIVIADLFDPAHPVILGSIHLRGEVRCCAVSGERLYAALGDSVASFDLSDPAEPRFLGSALTTGTATDLAVAGDHVYAACGQSVDYLDMAGTGSTDWDAGEAKGVGRRDASGRSTTPLSSRADRPDPEPLCSGQIRDLAVLGKTAYTAAGSGGLEVWSLTEPREPKRIGRLDLPGFARRIEISGRHAFVAAGEAGLRILDLSDTRAPRPAGNLPTPDARDLLPHGNIVYLADGVRGLLVVSVEDPSAPFLIAALPYPSPGSLALCGSCLCARTFSDGVWKFATLDISDPRHPRELSLIECPDGDGDSVARGEHAYLAGPAGLTVLDASEPEHPRVLALLRTPFPASGLNVSERTLYVVGAHRCAVFDLADPGWPVAIGSFEEFEDAQQVEATPGGLYVADRWLGIRTAPIRCAPQQPARAPQPISSALIR